MSKPRKSAVVEHRARLARRGMVRVEVAVATGDVGLVKGVAAALADPGRQVEARRVLRQHFTAAPKRDLKALLAAAPLEDIDLERSADVGREVDV